MADRQWTRVAKESDLKEGAPLYADYGDDEQVVIFRTDRGVTAFKSACSHYGAPLGDGLTRGAEATCPWHHARFDVRTGRMLACPAHDDLPALPVKVENGEILVGEPEPSVVEMPEGDDSRTFVIVGGGAAGHAAAEELRRGGFAGRIVMLTSESVLPYDRPPLSKGFLKGEKEPDSLLLHDKEFYDRLQIDVRFNHHVTGLDPANRTLSLAKNDPVKYDKLLLATGGTPRKPGLPGAELQGVHLLRSRADAEALLAAIEKTKKAVIVGAGFIGTEASAALRGRDIETHIVAPGGKPMSRILGDRLAEWLKNVHERNGVQFHLGRKMKEIAGNERVEAVLLDDDSRIEADLVLLAIGVEPAVAFLADTDLVEDGAVTVNPQLQTANADIYAAGDIARFPDPRTGEPCRVEHWVHAERQGQHAARSMLGDAAPWSEVPFFWSWQHDEKFSYIGHATDYDEIVLRGDINSDDGCIAGFYKHDVLRAIAATGRGSETIAIEMLLRDGGSVSTEQFADTDTDLVSLALSE